MDAFISRKKRPLSTAFEDSKSTGPTYSGHSSHPADEESTELKLALLASLYPSVDPTLLLDKLLAHDGCVEIASEALSKSENVLGVSISHKKPTTASLSYQSSLSSFSNAATDSYSQSTNPKKPKQLTRKGQTLHLYAPDDIAAHTPCSIIHNFLPADEADDLLRELLAEAPTFKRQTFKLFDSVVQSPHTACFYVQSDADERQQKTEYVYNGSYITDVRQILPHMRRVSVKVQAAVNREITTRIKTHYPGGKKLRYQSPREWIPNAAFVNCYRGGAESVGYHSDQLTYLGPRAVIGSLSLGVTRQFRVRKVVPLRDEGEGESESAPDGASTERGPEHGDRADAEGQIAIHLPHNSLLVMHAEMQEEWKHSIAPAPAIDPHPIAGNRRINITYRCYRDSFHPRYTPRCKCGVATVLKCVQRRRENRGRYFWMCYAGATPGKEGCTFFQWADFDDDGDPRNLKEMVSREAAEEER